MRTSSAKAKGRRACQEAADLIRRYLPFLKEDDIGVTPSGVKGEDLRLSPVARAALPIVTEVKNVETLHIWDALAQAQRHGWKKPGAKPVVIFRRNRTKLHICMALEDFLELYTRGANQRILDSVKSNERRESHGHEEKRENEVQNQVRQEV